jgi:hypothetical protein
MSQFPTLRERVKEIVAKLQDRQERLVPSQSGYRICCDTISMLMDALVEKKTKSVTIVLGRRGRPKGGHNSNNEAFFDPNE